MPGAARAGDWGLGAAHPHPIPLRKLKADLTLFLQSFLIMAVAADRLSVTSKDSVMDGT